MAAGIVTVGDKKYAVGLYWENSPGSGRVAQTAKEAARQPGIQADLYVVRPGNKDGRIPQFGLSSSESKQKAGMPVLAACLAGQILGSWVGAFRLNEGVVVIIVRDDLIVPDGDLFFLDEAEARDRVIQEIGFGGLQSTYAPEAWTIPGADTIPLSLLLNNRQDIRLQQVSLPKGVKIGLLVLAALFAAILGGVWYWQKQVDEENARAEAEARAREAALHMPLVGQQQMPEPKYDRKWESAPEPMDIIQACQEGLSKVSAGVSGWKLTTLKCAGSSLSLSWTRDKGITSLVPGTHTADTAASATQTIALQPLKDRGPENLEDPDVTTQRYLEQAWPGTIARINDDPPPPPPAGYTGPWNPPPPPWVKRSFTLSVPELPGSLPVVFTDLPGAMINSMSYAPGSGTSGTWTVDGVIYENRK